ncbi:Protein lethal(2)essential for life [Orchesella cincta]|uniref:Protein lethal(2)essential for life n=1 Tax=Orchesella cincta TaxID=48709 RepID=A0A1D2M2P9_ORCCI|nr:Protein lethal(2)essential for life [Orchesella cincta]
MAIVFERDPWGWVHPFYRRRPMLSDWDDFFLPTPKMNTMGSMKPLMEHGPPFTPWIINRGKHEEKRDEHGFVSRHFLRKYSIPPDVKPETINCDLSSDGILQISAPKMSEEKNRNEKVIPITYTGQPALPLQAEGQITAVESSGTVAKRQEAYAANKSVFNFGKKRISLDYLKRGLNYGVFVERDPLGWIHPTYRRRQLLSPNWDVDFVRPALETMNTAQPTHLNGRKSTASPHPVPCFQRADLARDKFEVKLEVQQFPLRNWM